MSRTEYWLLECAWHNYIAVWWLSGTAADSYEAQKRPRGVGNETTVDVLYELFQRGDIEAFGAKDYNSQSFARPAPSRQEIAHALVAGGYSLGYGLTDLGGLRFEEAIRPRWDQYVESMMGTNTDGDWEHEVTAMNVDLINEYLTQVESAGIVIAGTVQRDRVEPWEPTYWKVLPFGERLRVKLRPNNLGWPKRSDWSQKPTDLT